MRARIGAVRDKLFVLANELEAIRLDIQEPEDGSEQQEGTETTCAQLLNTENALRRECVPQIDDALRALPDLD